MSEKQAEIQALFNEMLAKGGHEPVAFGEDGGCTVMVDDDRPLHYQLCEDLGLLVLLMPVGGVPEAVKGEVYEQLLTANAYWGKTQGATLACNPELGEVIYQFGEPLEGLTAQRLDELSGSFMDAASHWRTTIAQLVEEAQSHLEEQEEAEEDPAEPETPRPGQEGPWLKP